MPPRALIVDLGNVIAFFDHRRACAQLAALTSPRLEVDDVFARVFGEGLEAEYDTGVMSTDLFLRTLRRRLGIEATDEAIAVAWCDMFTPNPPVIEAVAAASSAGLRLVLASNTNALHYGWLTDRIPEPLDRFDARVLSYEIGVRKPAPAFFERCLAAAGAPPAACLYVDDRADFVEAAARLGLPGLVYTPAVSLPDALAGRLAG